MQKDFSRKKYILAIDNKDLYLYTTLARFFWVTHSIRAFLLEIDPHSNVFETNESKTQKKPETLVSHTFTGLRNKNNHEDVN